MQNILNFSTRSHPTTCRSVKKLFNQTAPRFLQRKNVKSTLHCSIKPPPYLSCICRKVQRGQTDHPSAFTFTPAVSPKEVHRYQVPPHNLCKFVNILTQQESKSFSSERVSRCPPHGVGWDHGSHNHRKEKLQGLKNHWSYEYMFKVTGKFSICPEL